MSKSNGVNYSLGPFEWGGLLIVGCHKAIDGLPHLTGRSEADSLEHLSGQDAEPELHLVEPRSMGRSEVEVNIGIAPKPTVFLGLVGIKVVQHDVDLLVGTGGHHLVHEVQELPASPAGIVPSVHHAGGHLQGRQEGGGAV